MDVNLEMYRAYLTEKERCDSTITQYIREARRFISETEDGKPMTKAKVIEYKEKLCSQYKLSSVNAKIAAVNSLLEYSGNSEMKVRYIKMQKRAYCSQNKMLTKSEYLRLLNFANKGGDERLSLILQTLGNTGIRVSELRYITVEAVKRGEAYIWLKGKNRVILIAGKLQHNLKKYIVRGGITSGAVFVTRGNKPLDRSNIWKMLKRLSEKAGIDGRKVFPHNIRHMFARCFYQKEKDIAKLADVLGHSNINTTRIYIITSGREHLKIIDALGLVI